jgi:hypothetical protein
MLAVMRERDSEICRHVVASWRWWNPLAFYHTREARRLSAMNQRDLEKLPPERYHKPRPGAIAVSRMRP